MKNELTSTFNTKISLKAFKPEENIYEMFPTEKTKRKMSKNKYFSPEFSRDITINNSQNNIKEILNEFKYSEKDNLPSIISSPITNKYLTDFHKLKLNNPVKNVSNVNYLYFPNNIQKKNYNDLTLLKFFNSDLSRNVKEFNQELFNQLIYLDSLAKRIGKKERNLISDYIKNKIKVKNCTIIPPECVHNKFVKLLLLNINNYIENKLKRSGNITNEYINNLLKSQIDNLKYKIKQGIIRFKNIVNNELNNTSNNFSNKLYRTIRLKQKPYYNANLTSSIQYLKDSNKLLNYNNDNYSNYFSDNEDYIQEQKKIFHIGNFNEYSQETDSDKISLSSIVNNRNNRYISQEQKKSKMKGKYYSEEINVTIEFYDEEGNIIENNDNKPLILFDENGNQIFDYKIKKNKKYFNREGKQIFISIKNISKNHNSITSNKNHHFLDKLIDKKKNFSQNNLNEKTINSSKYSNNNSIEQLSHENNSFNKKDLDNKIMKKIFNKDKQYDNNIIDTQIYENNNSYSKSDIEEKKHNNNFNKINISESKAYLKRNNKASSNIFNSTKSKKFVKSQNNILMRNDALKKHNILLKRGIKTSTITNKFLSKYKKKNKNKKHLKDNEKIEEYLNYNDDIIDSNNDEKKLSKRFLTQSSSRKSIKVLKKEEQQIEKKKDEKEEFEEQKQKYEEEVKEIIHKDIIKNLTVQKKIKLKSDPKIIKLLQEKEIIQKLGLNTYELYEDNKNEDDKKNNISYVDEKDNKNNSINSHQYNYSKIGNENFIIYKGKDYFSDKKNNKYDQNLKNEYSSWVNNEIKKKVDNIDQKYSLIKTENEIKMNQKTKNNSQNNNLTMTFFNKANKKINKDEDEDEDDFDFERKTIIRKQNLKTPLNTKKIIKLSSLRNKFDNSIKDNEDYLPLSIKKPSSRSNDDNKNENKYSMNKLLSKIKKLKNLSQEEYDKELFSLVDKQIENIEIAKNRNKAERINVFIDRLNYLRQSKMNYHKFLSEKLIYKEPLNIRSFSDEKVKSKQNIMKGNLIENIKK